MHWLRSLAFLLTATCISSADAPSNLTVEGIPPVPASLRADASRYMDFRSASFAGWMPGDRGMLITTRFADTVQVHHVKLPGGARRQLTFGSEPVGAVHVQPVEGRCFVFSQDSGGGEFYQLLRYDFADARVTLLTDGKSRNTGTKWSRDGKWIAYTSTRRNGRDNDVFVQDPFAPASAVLKLEVSGGGWSVRDWSRDGRLLLLGEYLSANESRLHVLDLASGKVSRISPDDGRKVVWQGGQFAAGDSGVFVVTDRDGEFRQLARLDLNSKAVSAVSNEPEKWDVEEFEVSPDGKTLAYIVNEEGASRLKFLSLPDDGARGVARSTAGDQGMGQTVGVMGGLEWNPAGDAVAFTLSSARGPSDACVYSLPAKLTAWTESETGGLDFSRAQAAEVLRTTSADGQKLSGFLYRPDPRKFPGQRPCLINIHGGPEGQSKPDFIGRWNYLVHELGVAIFYPNVRGSAGFGKTFLALDNGFRREDSVRDIGAFIAALKSDPAIDGKRLAVMGGSYGGYMVLASMIHHGESLRCGVDIVGISNFMTFLNNTQDYRRDLRRVEYGDERDPKMAEHLARISPTARAGEIRKPLFIVQGANDPRVPVTEARQMRDAVRKAGGTVWYLEAADEGHGFAKKRNADFMFLSVVQFLKAHLVD